MIWKGLVCCSFYLLSSFVLLGSLHANQLSSGAGNNDSEEIIKQKWHSTSVLQQNVMPFLFVTANEENNPDNQLAGQNGFKDICCIQQEPLMGAFSLHYILHDGIDDDLANNEGWSALSILEGEDENDNRTQNEIDLSEVEDISNTNESESFVLDELSADLNEVCAKTPDLSTLQPEPFPKKFWNISENEISFDFFADLPKDKCPVVQKNYLADVGESYEVPDIPVFTNKKIEAFIHLYTQKKRNQFIKAVQRLPEYQEMIANTLIEYKLPLNLAYLAVVESNLNPNARSRANAVGLWQFMSYTGKHFGLSRSWWHDDRYDPEKSSVAAAQYLKQLHRQFKGDWELALAAYNSGSGTVRRAIRRAKRKGKPTDYWSLKLPRETRGYVPAFYAVSIIFANLEEYGFKMSQPVLVDEPKQYVDVGGGIALSQLAELFSVKQQVLSDINPRLRFRGLTPPTLDSFEVAIPASVSINKKHFDQLEDLKRNRHEKWKIHIVKQGESLWSISRFYQIPLNKILEYNRLRRRNLLRIGQQLMLPVPIDWNPPKQPSKTQLTILDMDKLPGVTKIHVVQKGETLWQISQKYNIPIRKIKYWNRRILKRKYLKIGTEIVLKIPIAVASNSI